MSAAREQVKDFARVKAREKEELYRRVVALAESGSMDKIYTLLTGCIPSPDSPALSTSVDEGKLNLFFYRAIGGNFGMDGDGGEVCVPLYEWLLKSGGVRAYPALKSTIPNSPLTDDTILHFLCRTGNTKLLQRIFADQYAMVENYTYRVAIHFIFRYLDVDEMRGSTYYNPRDEDGVTLFCDAVEHCQEEKVVEVVQLLLAQERHVRLDIANENGDTPLHAAVKKGNEELARLLLERGANVDRANKDGFTPLHTAVKKGNEELARLLLERGANVDQANKDGFTPLHTAVKNGNEGLARLLLERGADVNIANENGDTPLHTAVKNGNEELARLLLERGVNVDQANKDGFTPLHTAVKNGNEGLARLLLERGADVNQKARDVRDEALKDYGGFTPIHIAVNKGNKAMVQLLLDWGADVNQNIGYIKYYTCQMYTPLHSAVVNGHAEIVQLLLDRGAAISTSGRSSRTRSDTPFQLASSSRYYLRTNHARLRIADMLLLRGATSDFTKQPIPPPENMMDVSLVGLYHERLKHMTEFSSALSAILNHHQARERFIELALNDGIFPEDDSRTKVLQIIGCIRDGLLYFPNRPDVEVDYRFIPHPDHRMQVADFLREFFERRESAAQVDVGGASTGAADMDVDLDVKISSKFSRLLEAFHANITIEHMSEEEEPLPPRDFSRREIKADVSGNYSSFHEDMRPAGRANGEEGIGVNTYRDYSPAPLR